MINPETATQYNDSLLSCLALVCRLFESPIHPTSLRSGFALDDNGCIPRESYPDLASRHGMIAAWATQSIDTIPNYVLPVIVPFIDGRSAVLKSVKDSVALILMPETGMTERTLPVLELMSLSTGQVLVVKPKPKQGAQQLVMFRGAAFSWFWGTLWRFRRFYIDSLVATLVANILTLAIVFYTMNVFNRVIPVQAYNSLWTLTIGVALAMFLEFVMRWLKARLVDQGGRRADLVINATLLREIMTIRLDHRPQSIGVFASSMRDFESLREFFSSASFVVIADLPFTLMFLILIWIIGGPIVWVPVAVIPILLIVGFMTQRPIMRATQESMKESGERQSILVEALSNMEMLKSHNAEGYLQSRWEKANKASVDAYMKVRSTTAFLNGFTSTLQQACSVGVIVVGVYLIDQNLMTLGALIACNILAGRAVMPLGAIMQLFSRFEQAKTSLVTLDALLKRPHDRDFDRHYIAPERFYGSLSVENLEFAYPAQEPIPVVNGISFSLMPGDHLALLGPIGCGKSTLLRMMGGLYKPMGGSIRIDDIDIQQIDPGAFRSKMGYVGQDAQLCMGTLRENLLLSDVWLTDEHIIRVLKTLGLYQMVAAHPLGLDMPLTESGGGLSGGQRQLITVARMLLRDPVYVFLDEPTAHMDQDSEARVIRVLAEWLKDRTVVLSTHRPQLLTLANRVAVMQAGKVVAEGPRDEMMQKLSRTPSKASVNQAHVSPHDAPMQG